jgi:hypothetical protein
VAAEEARLRAEEQSIRQAREAAESKAQALRSEEARLGALLTTLHVIAAARAGEAAHQAVVQAAEDAERSRDEASSAARGFIRSQFAALRAIIDDREQQLVGAVDRAHEAAMESIIGERRKADACAQTLDDARITTPLPGTVDAALPLSAGAAPVPSQDALDAVVAQLNAHAASLRDMARGMRQDTPPMTSSGTAVLHNALVSIIFDNEEAVVEGVRSATAAFGTVHCRPGVVATSPGRTDGDAHAAATGAATVSYAVVVTKEPPAAGAVCGTQPASPPPSPACPEAFPPLPRTARAPAGNKSKVPRGAKGRASDAGAATQGLAPAGPDSHTDSSDGDSVASQGL